jgi:hypothetical protein
MPKRRYLGIESKDFVVRTGSSSKKRARLIEKLDDLIGRARFLAVREQLPAEANDADSSDERESRTVLKSPESI